jgi:hypothetical protein
MQHEITDAVGLFVGAPPDLLGGQALDGLFDLWQEVVGKILTRLLQEKGIHI